MTNYILSFHKEWSRKHGGVYEGSCDLVDKKNNKVIKTFNSIKKIRPLTIDERDKLTSEQLALTVGMLEYRTVPSDEEIENAIFNYENKGV